MRPLLLVSLLLCVSRAEPQGVTDAHNTIDSVYQAWVSHYPMPDTSINEVATDMVLDALGNVYVTGYAGGSGAQDYITIKYNSSGSRQWIARYNGPGNGDFALALAVDGSGNVYVTGYSYVLGTNPDYATIKYNSSGVEQWVTEYNGPGNGYDVANALAIDGSGNVYVTGYSYGPGTQVSDYATIKYNPSGVQQWVARYNPGNEFDFATALSVDGSGNVYVTGYSRLPGSLSDYATIKYNSSGVVQWIARYDGPGNGEDLAYALAVDGSGNVYVTGESRGSGTNQDYATVKYNSSGIQQWAARYNGPGNAFDHATALAVDGSGNVYVTGYSRGAGTFSDYATIKYNSFGIEQWVTRYNGPANSEDFAKALAVDGSGNVYVTGYSGVSFSPSGDYVTIKYNPSGVQQWTALYNVLRGVSLAVEAAIAVDGSGNVLVAGTSVGSDSTGDFVTVKYDNAGMQQWITRPGYDCVHSTSAFTLDSQGNLYITGSTSGSGTDFDYVTVKYDASGNQQWIARYDGPASSTDLTHAITVDSARSVYVTGGSRGSGTDLDYATIKYNAAGVQQWVARYNGPAFDIDDGAAIAVDNAGNVYVAGSSIGTGLTHDYATLKYNANGQLQWVIRYNGPGDATDLVSSLVIDGAGNLYVAGTSTGSGTMSDYATVKYNSSGVEQWVARYNGPGNNLDFLNAMSIDAATNIYVTGWSVGSGTDRDYATIKYNSAGVEQWVARYDDPASSLDEANAIAVDRFGNVYVTGHSPGAGTGNDYTTIKYTSSGVREWVSLYNGPTNSDDEATHIALDSAGSAYVTGRSNGLGTGDDYATVKYNNAGIQEWVTRYEFDSTGVNDRPSGISVGESGDVYVAGTSGMSNWSVWSIAKYAQPGFVSVGDIPELPSRFSLSQNYPNPFNPTTTISFDIPYRTRATLAVYNLLGQHIATLVDEEREAGRYQIEWNAGSSASGVYLYRLQVGGFVSTKKLILLR